MILINCVFKLPCIVDISSYKKEQLKLHGSLLGVKGGGGSASEQSSLQHLAVMIKLIVLGHLVKSATNSTNTL